jgi:hypothetical protein
LKEVAIFLPETAAAFQLTTRTYIPQDGKNVSGKGFTGVTGIKGNSMQGTNAR